MVIDPVVGTYIQYIQFIKIPWHGMDDHEPYIMSSWLVSIYMYIFIYSYLHIQICVYIYIPVVPHKAVAEVSKIGSL